MSAVHSMPNSEHSALVGEVVADRYKIVSVLGGGGMGAVYRAEHLALGSEFALKVLHVGTSSDEVVKRFQREARALAKIRSPRVAQVTDFGTSENTGPFYVMEMIDGKSLQERLDQGPLPLGEAVRRCADLCDALADVHDAGIVHRDLKPSNIGLPEGGPIRVKLLDFGLAASVDDEFLTRITRSHQVIGSLPYIAPEQFSGARPSKPQDMWALGVVLHEMLEGKLPFDAPTAPALIHKILTGPTPTISRIEHIELHRLIDGLLQKDPADRVTDARKVGEQLRHISQSPRFEPEIALPRTSQSPQFSHHESGVRTSSVPVTRAQPIQSSEIHATPVLRSAEDTPAAQPKRPFALWLGLGLLVALIGGGATWIILDGMSSGPDPIAPGSASAPVDPLANAEESESPEPGVTDSAESPEPREAETPTAEGPTGNEAHVIEDTAQDTAEDTAENTAEPSTEPDGRVRRSRRVRNSQRTTAPPEALPSPEPQPAPEPQTTPEPQATPEPQPEPEIRTEPEPAPTMQPSSMTSPRWNGNIIFSPD